MIVFAAFQPPMSICFMVSSNHTKCIARLIHGIQLAYTIVDIALVHIHEQSLSMAIIITYKGQGIFIENVMM